MGIAKKRNFTSYTVYDNFVKMPLTMVADMRRPFLFAIFKLCFNKLHKYTQFVWILLIFSRRQPDFHRGHGQSASAMNEPSSSSWINWTQWYGTSCVCYINLTMIAPSFDFHYTNLHCTPYWQAMNSKLPTHHTQIINALSAHNVFHSHKRCIIWWWYSEFRNIYSIRKACFSQFFFLSRTEIVMATKPEQLHRIKNAEQLPFSFNFASTFRIRFF